MGEREEVRLVEQAAIVTKSDAGMANPDVFSNAFDLRKGRGAAPSISAARRLSRPLRPALRSPRPRAWTLSRRSILLSSSRTK